MILKYYEQLIYFDLFDQDITGTISESNNISSKELFIKVTGWRNYYSALPVSIPFIAGESEIK